MAIQQFLDLCFQYLTAEISVAQFVETFEMYMFDYGDEVDEEYYIYLDKILAAVTYYDADTTKEDDENFVEEAELRSIVKDNVEKIKTVLNA